jgi:hypothetical protein
VRGEAGRATGPDAPVVRITGTAFMGSIDVTVVDPAADARPAWVRALLPRRRD